MKRVFVADDDFIMTKLYQMHFKRGDIEGTFFSSGRELLAQAEISLPDGVVLDYELPDIPGPEVMRLLHQLSGNEAIPVFFVTARATPELESDLIRQGAKRVFGKPFSPAELIGGLKGLA